MKTLLKWYTWANFPGIVMHEIAHRLICDLFKIDVYQVKYFIPDSPVAGHVIFAGNNSFIKNCAIALAPLFINSVLCMLLTFPLVASSQIEGLYLFSPPLYLFLGWIGFSMGVQAMPSPVDVELVMRSPTKRRHLLIFPLLLPIQFIHGGEIPFQIVYAFWISRILPCLIFGKEIILAR